MLGFNEMDAYLSYAGRTSDDVAAALEADGASTMPGEGWNNALKEFMKSTKEAGVFDYETCTEPAIYSGGIIKAEIKQFKNGPDIGIPWKGKNQEGINVFNIPFAQRCNAVYVNILPGGMRTPDKDRRNAAAFRSAFQVLSCKNEDGSVDIKGKATTQRYSGDPPAWCSGEVDDLMADSWFRKILSKVRFKAVAAAAAYGSGYISELDATISTMVSDRNKVVGKASWEKW